MNVQRTATVRVCFVCYTPTQTVVRSQDTQYCPRCKSITGTRQVEEYKVRPYSSTE
jgi:hypothetical protein